MDDTRNLMRTRKGHEHGKVANIELFFDLAFVFAITQLSHLLIEHLSLAGAIQALLLLLAVWWVWICTARITNWLDPERVPVRFLLFVLMMGGLILSSSITRAFESGGVVFASAYVFLQVGRTLFVLWALGRRNPGLSRNFQRILAWLILSAAFWVAGGLAEGGARLALWMVALAIDYLSPLVGFWVPLLGRSATGDWDEGGHLAERSTLLITIAIGGSILITGATFSGLEWTPATVAAFVASVIGSISMWWLYFDGRADSGSVVMASPEFAGRPAWSISAYIHVLLVAGIILCVVSGEFILAHPGAAVGPRVAMTILGGAGLYFLGSLLLKRARTRKMPASALVGIVALLAVGVFTQAMTLLTLTMSTSLVLVGAAIWERVTRNVPPRQMGSSS